MHIKQIAVVAAFLGTASLTLNAGELVAKNSIQGRSGIHTVVHVQSEKPTIALSKQGEGVGRTAAEEREVKQPQWHNPSRMPVNVTAHN